MKKKLKVFGMTIIVGIGSILSLPSINVEATSFEIIQQQRSGIKADVSRKNEEISQVQDDMTKLNEQIARVEQAIIDNNNMIVQTAEKVRASQTEVGNLQQEVNLIKDRINKRNIIIKKRALSLQESGGKVSYMDVLFGASSFSDFVGRLSAVATMVEADQDLVKQQQDQKEVELKQSSVESKLEDLKGLQTELEGMKAQFLEQKEQNEALKVELKVKEQEKLSEKANLLQQEDALASQEEQLKSGSQNSPSDMSNLNILIPTTSNEAINIVIHAGAQYIGNSVYVFGGGRNAYDVAHGRFDCSGFVAWAFAQAGIKVGAHTDILKNTGTRVSMSEARPGDLVFFDTYKIDGHVGIYLGDGKFIGSQSSTGIAIADMTNGYYQKKFNGRVMRIINN